MLPACAIVVGSFIAGAVIGWPHAPSQIIFVDDSASSGANDGTSWNDAFTELQDALAIAKAGDEIRIGQGIYTPAQPGGLRTATFQLVSGVVLQGGYAGLEGTDPDALDWRSHPTYLTGYFQTDTAYHVVTGVNLAKGTAVRGLHIGGGSADEDEPPHNSGAGMRLTNSFVDVTECAIQYNYAYSGASGIRSSGGLLRLKSCLLQVNFGGMPVSSSAAALSSDSSVAIDCVFLDNHAGQSAGAASGSIFHSCTFRDNGAEDGGAIRDAEAVINCLFENNHALYGGAMRGGSYIINSVFRGNTAGDEGGAIDTPGAVINCHFSGNICSGNAGGAIVFWHFDPGYVHRVINCTFEGNHMGNSTDAGSALYLHHAIADVSGTILWNNSAPQSALQNQILLDSQSTLHIDHSCVRGWTGSFGGVGNHGSDPRFVDADGPDNIYGTADDDVRLRPNSLCIDSADASLLPPDTYDIDEDDDVSEPLPIDLDGLPRVVGSTLDAGAYEFQGLPCRADIDGNNAVNVFDLLQVISTWGPCAPAAMCNADLDLNRAVGVSDLLKVINTWGNCP